MGKILEKIAAEAPFVGAGLAGGLLTYAGFDLYGHGELFDNHIKVAAIGGISVSLWYLHSHVFHGKRISGLKVKKKKVTLDDYVGAGVVVGVLTATSLIPMAMKMHTDYVRVTEDFIRRGWGTLDLIGGLMTPEQIAVTRENQVDMLKDIGRIDASLAVYGIIAAGMISQISAIVRTKEKRDATGKALRILSARLLQPHKVKGIIEGYAQEFPIFHRELAQYSLRDGKYDDAFDHIARFINTEDLPRILDLTSFGAYIELSRLSRADEASPETHLKRGSAYLLIGSLDGYANAEREFSRASDVAGEQKGEYALLHALFLTSVRGRDDERTREAWSAVAGSVMADDSLAIERIGETANKVYAKGSTFLRGQLLFKEKHSLEDAVLEEETNSMVGDILKGGRSSAGRVYAAADIVGVIGGDKPAVVMQRAEGVTLWEKIQEKRYGLSDFLDIVPVLARLHAHMPYSGIEEYAGKVRARLESQGVDSAIVEGIAGNYLPVLQSFAGQRIVCNIDGHPENWYFTKDRVLCLDNERRVGVPAVFDLVNLLEYGTHLTDDLKLKVIAAYAAGFSVEAKEQVDMPSLLFAYRNAVIHRAICLSSAWSTRSNMGDMRLALVRNANHALQAIRQDHAEQYFAYLAEYVALERFVNRLA